MKICREELSALERGGGHRDEPAFARKGSCKIGEKLFPRLSILPDLCYNPSIDCQGEKQR